jgi:two-component system, NtrC family, sensor histidine kinase HydH
MPLERKARRLQAIAVSIVLASIVVAYIFTLGSLPFVGKILRYLLFLPIVMAALWFGWRGGLVAALAATALYLPADHSEEAMVEAVDLFLIGSIMGILAERERRKRILLQQTTRELSLAYQQLQDSMESLRRAARLSATGQLAASLAHEIRTPLASIEGAAEMLDGEVAPELRSEMTGILRKESRRLSRLLAGLLNYAKPRPPEFRDSDVRDLLSGMIALAAPSARKSNVELRFAASPDPVPLYCDGEQLTQVFLNLTMNAIQAMPTGGAVEFSIETSPTAVCVRIADTGPGIPADQRARIFDPFVTSKPDGTGLGLAVSAQIVTAHQGQITVNSREPHGTEFVVELPVRQEQNS